MSGHVELARKQLLDAIRPLLDGFEGRYSARKVIHDPIWGTTRLEPWEAALLDIPYFQRLRGLKQTGFAHFTYPSAEHSRFQHTIGVMHAAGEVFDSLNERLDEDAVTKRTSGDLEMRLRTILGDPRNRALLRLTAMVHDLGHSFYSHTSERIFSLVEPFPAVIEELRSASSAKLPGAAEVAVYLLITSSDWKDRANAAWRATTKKVTPPTDAEWEQIGRWVMGQEDREDFKFFSDIISGPIDADKLDYIARDAYSAGLPITYDLERFISTVCVDEQNGRLRLTIPFKGINALEQLVMSRLILNSYLYHHQKVRAAEVTLERALLRELIADRSVLGTKPPWPLFAMEDADVYGYAKLNPKTRIAALVRRQLPVRIAEFRRWSLEKAKSEPVTSAYTHLLSDEMMGQVSSYQRRLDLEDELAKVAGLDLGDVIIDVPRPPKYKDLEDLEIPHGDAHGSSHTPHEMLDYHRWIDAYQAHRAYIRIFVPRHSATDANVWTQIKKCLHEKSLPVPESARRNG